MMAAPACSWTRCVWVISISNSGTSSHTHNAYLAGVFAEHVHELHADGVAERLRHLRDPRRLLTLDVGVYDRLAAALAGRPFDLRDQLELKGHQFTYTY